jgi:transposase
MGPYGIDLRARIVEAHRNGEGSVRELAEQFAVAPNTVQNYLTRYRTTGSVVPRPHGGGVGPTINERGQERLRALVKATPDATEDELADALVRRHHIVVSGSTVGRTLRRMGMTRKKNASCNRARSARCDRRASNLRERDRGHPS